MEHEIDNVRFAFKAERFPLKLVDRSQNGKSSRGIKNRSAGQDPAIPFFIGTDVS
jgi:hypothetical protein